MDFKSSSDKYGLTAELSTQGNLWTGLESMHAPRFIQGNCLDVLKEFEADSVDCCMTSPPYWGQREYLGKGDGQETSIQEYLTNLLAIFSEVRRILKPTGSFWLNIGDWVVAS